MPGRSTDSNLFAAGTFDASSNDNEDDGASNNSDDDAPINDDDVSSLDDDAPTNGDNASSLDDEGDGGAPACGNKASLGVGAWTKGWSLLR